MLLFLCLQELTNNGIREKAGSTKGFLKKYQPDCQVLIVSLSLAEIS